MRNPAGRDQPRFRTGSDQRDRFRQASGSIHFPALLRLRFHHGPGQGVLCDGLYRQVEVIRKGVEDRVRSLVAYRRDGTDPGRATRGIKGRQQALNVRTTAKTETCDPHNVTDHCTTG